MDNNEGLNFDQANLSGAVAQAAHQVDILKDGIYPAIAIIIFLGILVSAYSKAKKSAGQRSLNITKIKNFPVTLKAALFVLILSYAFTHLFAAGSVFYNTRVANPGAENYFKDLGVGRLLSLSHAHLFAHATMYFVLAFLVNLCEGSFLWIGFAPLLSLWAGVFDVVSWWGAKLLSPNFERLSALSGTAFSFGFLGMAWILFKNICTPCDERKNV